MNEGMSNTVLESISCGLPLILTDVGGTAELIKKNGFVVDVRSPIQIADAIAELYNNPELDRRMGMNSRNHARLFDWQNVAQNYLEFYKKFLQI